MTEIICNATKVNGGPCKVPVVAVQEQCIGHLPNAHLARAKGGEQSSALARVMKYIPAEYKELRQDLFQGIQDVKSGQMSPQQGASIATMANSIMKLHETFELKAQLEEAIELMNKKMGKQDGA